jgi:hypothetical protein
LVTGTSKIDNTEEFENILPLLTEVLGASHFKKPGIFKICF